MLLVGPVPPPVGGIETGILQLVRSRLGARYIVGVVNTSSRRPPGYRGRLDLLNLAHAALQTFNLVSRVVALRPSIVQIAAPHGLGFLKAGWLLVVSRMLGRKVILEVHTGLPYGDTFVPARIEWAVPLILRAATVVRVLSPGWQRYLSARYGLSNTLVIPNGVQVRTCPRRPGDRGVVTVLSVGRLGPAKGIPEIIEAAALVRSRYRHVRFQLVGEWESAVAEARLRGLARDLGVHDVVDFVGEVDPQQISEYYCSADIYVLASRSEGLPRSLLEAMGHGLPVVATPVGAISEVVQDGRNGYLVPVGDVHALSRAILDLCSNAEKRCTMGEVARQTIIEGYSLDSELEQWERLYWSLVADNSRQAGSC